MNFVDKAIEIVKNENETELTNEEIVNLIQKLYYFVIVKANMVTWIKKVTSQNAEIKVCFGENREEIFLLNQPKISEGDIIIINGKNIVVEKVAFKFFKKESIGQNVDAFLQVLN